MSGKTAKRARARTKPATLAPKTGSAWGALWTRDRWFFPALFALALLLRCLYIFQIRGIQTFDSPVGDGEAYDRWAQDLAAGDWLGDEPFYQAPLYPYLLGLIYAVFGRDLLAARLVQALMGATSCLLLARAGEGFFNRDAGRLSGLMLAVYPVAIYFDGLIQKTSLAFVLFALILFLISRIEIKPGAKRWLGVGLALGFLGLTRENGLILTPILLAWLWIRHRGERPGRRVAWSAAMIAGMFVVFLPATLRNLAVADRFQISTSNLGPNLYIGNNPDANGRYAPLRWGRSDWKFEREDAESIAEEAAGRELTASQVSRYWLGRAVGYMTSQPLDWLALMARKTAMVWNAVEIADTEDIYTFSRQSWLMGALLFAFHFGVLCPLAIFGAVATWRRWSTLWPLYAIALGYAASVAIFFVFDRFRFPTVGVLLLFAGAGALQLRRLWTEPQARRGLRPALIIALLTAAFANWPLIPKETFTANSELALGNVLAKEGRHGEAVEHFERSLAANPNRPQTHIALGNAYLNLGQVERAKPHLEKAAALKPDFSEAFAQLGLAHALAGDGRRAVEAYRRALELEPRQPTALNNLAWILATAKDDALRDGAEAVALAEAACALTDRQNAGRLDTLAAALAEAGRFDEAIAVAEEGLALANAQNLPDRAAKLKTRLTAYRSGQPIRQ